MAGVRLLLGVGVTVVAVVNGGSPYVTRQPGAIVSNPAWSPDGTRIVWTSTPAGSDAEQVWTAAADGTHARRVRDAASADDLQIGVQELAWIAPDKLALEVNNDLYLASIAGGGRLVAADIGDGFSHDAAGDRIAFQESKCCSSTSSIVILDRATGKRVVIGGARTHYGEPSLAPNGSHVAFDSPSGLMVADSDGRNLRQIATRGYCPSWSPDGSQLVYVDNRDDALRLVSPSTDRTRTLAPKEGVCGFAPARTEWSPNGKTIAALGIKNGHLSLINVATGKTNTVSRLDDVIGFAWSPDSSTLLIAERKTPSGCSSLWRINADGTHPKLIIGC